jgi:replicative DNA helicase
MNNNIESFGYLGYQFQLKLIGQFIYDKTFADTIIYNIEAKYFDNQYFRLIMANVKNYYERYETTPTFEALRQVIKLDTSDEITQQYVEEIIVELEGINHADIKFIQEKSIEFCKQQELKKAIIHCSGILDKGDIDNYDECEEVLRKALSIGTDRDDGIDVFDNIENVLSAEFRSPIPTGVKGLDELMEGGLSRGELGMVIAPLGVGKTTFMTKVANTAQNEGKTVLQIVFEDHPKVLQRKHYSCQTGIPLNELESRKDEVIRHLEKMQSDPSIGKVIIKRMTGENVTISKIRQLIRKHIAKGIKLDMIILDYIDCVVPDSHHKDQWVAEGYIMRQFENLISEFDLIGWVATQGNRSSINATTVTTDMMGGSIKKAQIGHFILSIAKDLTQKESGRANLAVIKSRFGRDGVVFENIKFDNSTIVIDTDDMEELAYLDYEDRQRQRQENRNRDLARDTFKKISTTNKVEREKPEYISNTNDSDMSKFTKKIDEGEEDLPF